MAFDCYGFKLTLNDRNKSGLTGQVGLTDVCVKQSNQEFDTKSDHETACGCKRPLHWKQMSDSHSLDSHHVSFEGGGGIFSWFSLKMRTSVSMRMRHFSLSCCNMKA